MTDHEWWTLLVEIHAELHQEQGDELDALWIDHGGEG